MLIIPPWGLSSSSSLSFPTLEDGCGAALLRFPSPAGPPASSCSGVQPRPINTSLATARVTPPSPDQVCLAAPLVDASLSVVLELSSSQHHCKHRRRRRHHQHRHQTSTTCSWKTTRVLDAGDCAPSHSLLRRVLFAGISIPSQNIAMFSPRLATEQRSLTGDATTIMRLPVRGENVGICNDLVKNDGMQLISPTLKNK